MDARLTRLLTKLRFVNQPNTAIQLEATHQMMRRLPVIAAAVFLLNLGYAAIFWFGDLEITTPQIALWVSGIGWSHLVMGLCMAVLGPSCYLVSRQERPCSALSLGLQDAFSSVCLLFGIALSTFDQWATANTTLFALTNLAGALLTLRRPRVTLPLYVSAYIIFYWTLALTQEDPLLLGIARGHAFGATCVSFLASVLIWRQFVTSTLLRWELARKQDELEFQATHDALTGLFNRREFLRMSEVELVRARRYPADISLIMVDLDNFKKINDTYGHPVGDEVLKQTARLLRTGVRASDLVARLGGEEFVILLCETPEDGARALAEALRKLLNRSLLTVSGLTLTVSASFGVSSLLPGQGDGVEELYSSADQALYRAKQAGRNCVL